MYALGGLLHKYCVTCSDGSNNAHSELCVTHFSFDRTKHDFVTSDFPVISHIIAHENIAICDCQLAVEHTTGITKVYFLLGDISKVHTSGPCIFYLCVIAANRVVVVGKITLVTDSGPETLVSISIVDGPNVCLLMHSGSLYYTWPSATGENVELLSVDSSPCSHLTSLLWCGCDHSTTQLVAIGTCVQHPDAMETCSDSDQTVVAVTLGRNKQGQCASATLVSTNIVPPQYASIILCIYIKQLTIESPDQNTRRNGTNARDTQMSRRSDTNTSLPISASALACTSYSQLLLFEKGRLLKCGSLPFNDADKIVVFETSLDSEYIAVHSANNVVCLILAATFEVVRVVNGMTRILVDDFVGSGSEQVLLLPQQESDTTGQDGCPLQFLLTDFSSCHANSLSLQEWPSSDCLSLDGNTVVNLHSAEGDRGTQGDLGESLQGVARALETRVQVGYRCLADAERQGALKARLITRSCDAIRRMTSCTENVQTPRLGPHLVPLVHGSGADRCDNMPEGDGGPGNVLRSTPGTAGVEKTGDLRLTGSAGVEKTGDLRLTGIAGVEKTGDLRLTGSAGVEKTGDLRLTGIAGVEKTGDLRLTGSAGVEKTGDLRLTGSAGVEKTGDLRLTGSAGVEKTGDLRLTGSAGVEKTGDLRLTTTWQRIIYENWVVTVVVTNVSPRVILMPRLCLVSVDDDPVAMETRCTCSVGSCAHDVSFERPLQKMCLSSEETWLRCVPPGGSATLSVCCVGRPRFIKTRQRKFALTVIYETETCGCTNSSVEGPCDRETKGTCQKGPCDRVTKGICQKCVVSDCVGYTELRVEDVLDGSLGIDATITQASDVHLNTVSLTAAQTRYSLQVTRCHGNVVDAFTNALLQGLRFVCLDAGHICLQAGPLYLVRAFGREVTTQLLGEVTSQLMDIVVYARDESQLLLFLHAITALLPDDVTITPANQSRRVRAAIENVTSAMRSQMTYCRQELQSMIVNAESEPDSRPSSEQLPQQGRKQSIDSTREEFASIQQQVRRRTNGKCDGKMLEVFREEVKRLGKDTDAALVELAVSRDSRL